MFKGQGYRLKFTVTRKREIGNRWDGQPGVAIAENKYYYTKADLNLKL